MACDTSLCDVSPGGPLKQTPPGTLGRFINWKILGTWEIFILFRRSWPFPGHSNQGGTLASPAQQPRLSRGSVLPSLGSLSMPPCPVWHASLRRAPGMRVRPALARNTPRDPRHRGPDPSLPRRAASESCWVHVAAICSTRGLCPEEPGFVQNEKRILCMFQPLSISSDSDEALRFPRC